MKSSPNSMGFAGMDNADRPAPGSTRLDHNQHTGHSNDGRLVNKGRGPTVGNDGRCGHSGMKNTAVRPPARA